jgi:hypothetical protein
MYTCMYIYVSIYTCIYTCANKYMYINICIYINLYLYIYVYVERMLTMSKVIEEKSIGNFEGKVEERLKLYDMSVAEETSNRTVSDVIKANMMDPRIFNLTEIIQDELNIDDNSNRQDAERSRALRKIEADALTVSENRCE